MRESVAPPTSEEQHEVVTRRRSHLVWTSIVAAALAVAWRVGVAQAQWSVPEGWHYVLASDSTIKYGPIPDGIGFQPGDGVYTTRELTQDWAVSYYNQFLMRVEYQRRAEACESCNRADVDRSGTVDMNDLVAVLSHWLEVGSCN